MNDKEKLLGHPYWAASDPNKMRLVRIYDLPSEANPFAEDGVVLRVAAAPGETPYHKVPMARAGILEGIKSGRITRDTTIVEATSGNTGLAMASICTMLGLKFDAVISKDVPESKISVIRALGAHIGWQTPNTGETTVECARRLGAQDGKYNPDQYASEWNPTSHYQHLMPQIFALTPASVFVAPGGTMGTVIAAQWYALNYQRGTKVVPVMCAEGQEVPAARTLARVKKDIRLPWEKYFNGRNDIQFATRFASFFASFFSWRFIPVQLGPSFGLALVGALKFLRQQEAAGTLRQFRKDDGKIYVIVLGPDDYRPYAGLYLAYPFYEKDFVGVNLLEYIDRV
jgi:cysteine synthase